MNQVIAARYELTERIGSGGMGVVWRAHDRTLHRTVAVKVIAGPGVSAEAVSRLEREARAAAGLSRNPHVVTVHDFGHEGAGADGDDCAYVVMELVEGRTLDKVLTQDGLPAPARAVEWARQVCVALEAAHAIGVVHRDIKPSNVILGPDGVIQVLDFGLAWFHPELGLGKLSRSDAVMGSAPWMSPEQAQGKTVDHRSDLYSLGCLLYELITGAPPFGGRDALAQLIAHVMEEPLAPSGSSNAESSAGRDITPPLDRLVLELLAKSPDHRPFSASLVAARLGGVRESLGEMPTAAVPPAQSPEMDLSAVLPPVPAEEMRKVPRRPSRRQFLVIAVGVVVPTTAVVVPYVLPDSGDGGGADGGSGGRSEDEKSSPPRRLWNVPVVAKTGLPVAAAGPVVLVNLPGKGGDGSGGFQVRDARNGNLLWAFKPVKDANGDLESFGVDLDPQGATVYISRAGGEVVARDATTGRTKWNYKMDRPEGGVTAGGSSLAFADGVVYVTDLGKACAVASGDGDELWTVPLDDTTITTVLVGRVLLVRAMLHLYAVSVDEKRVIWQQPTEQSELTIGGGIVFVTPTDTGDSDAPSVTLAINIADGAERWSDPSRPEAVLAERNLVAYVGSDRDLLRARSLDSGKKLYQKAIPSSMGNPPQVVGDILVEWVRRGEEYSVAGIGLKDGTVRWHQTFGNIQNDGGTPYGKALVTSPTGKSLRALSLTTGEARWAVTPDEKRLVLAASRVGNLLFVITGQSPAGGSPKAERLHCLKLTDAT
ncbi:serine/threonine-protein kinase [Streptomyces sp. NPDC048680]|uniref:serine/threonine-protein kinase n=1 Tax=Streptomyces sp. NPDC048680 TaxID=3155492 RepID=UPI0034178EA8